MQSLSHSRLAIVLGTLLVVFLAFLLASRFSSSNVEKKEAQVAQLATESKTARAVSTKESKRHKKRRRKGKAPGHKTQRERTADIRESEVVTPSEEQRTPKNLSSLSGKVLDVWSGGGVANAGVSLNSYNPNGKDNNKRSKNANPTPEALERVRTLTNGAFLMSNIPSGDYKLRVAADGYSDKIRSIGMPPAQAIRDLTIYLELSYTISGRVTDERHDPIPKAIVRIIGGEKKRTRTRYDGRYTLEDLWRGNHNILVEAKGYGSTRLYDIPAGSSDVDVVLYPGGSISGKVVDGETGLPVANAKVNAFMQAVKSSRVVVALTRTDGNGSYAIADVGSGHYVLWAKHRDKTSPLRIVGVKQSEHARDVNLELLPAGSISGRIIEKGTGNPVPNITVLASTNAIVYYTRAVSRGDGAYRLAGLGPGEYSLELHTSGNDVVNIVEESPMNLMSSVFVSAGSNTAGADFIVLGTSHLSHELTEPAYVSGEIVDESDNGVAGARVLLGFLASTPFGVRLSSSTSTLSDERGRFSFDNVNGKRVFLRARHPQYENNAIELTLKSGEDKRDVKIPLKARTTTGISGRITDTMGHPIAGARIAVIGEGTWPARATDVDGRYALVGIAPGEYDVRVEKEGYENAIIRHVVVGRAEIKDGTDFELTAEEGHYITGMVVDEQGIPMPGARVTVYGHGKRKMTEADIQGAFRVGGLEHVIYSITVNDWAVTRQQITLHEVEVDRENLRIVIERSTGGISGRVVDALEQPVRKFTIVYSSRNGKKESKGGDFLYSTRGEFVIEALEPGEYRVKVVDAESGNSRMVDGIVVNEGQITSDVVIELPSGISVSGVVVNAVGVPIRGALVCAGGIRDIMNFAYEKGRGTSNTYLRHSRSGPDGAFLLDKLPDTVTSVGAYHPDYAPGEVYFERAANSGTVSGLKVVLSQGGDVSGIVRDTTGAPIVGVSVYVLPRFKTAKTDAKGLFRFEKLAPMEYCFAARHRTSRAWKKQSVRQGEEAYIELVLGESKN